MVPRSVGNGSDGIDIQSASNTIGGTVAGAGNVISGNFNVGLNIIGSGATNNFVEGNFIGTNAVGTAALANGGNGIAISGGATSNSIGNGLAGGRNIISGNSSAGISIAGIGTNSNVVFGNYIGTDATGTQALGNGTVGVPAVSQGILIFNGPQNNYIGTNGDGVNDANEGNLISGNLSDGVKIQAANNNVVAGNFIGVDATGTAALGNGRYGVFILQGSTGNRIGTNADGQSDTLERNIISGNGSSGILLDQSSSNTIAGNYIGTNAAGSAALAGAVDGVVIQNSSTNNTIGGTLAGTGNVVVGSGLDGILLQDINPGNNLVAGNIIGADRTGLIPLGGFTNGIDIQSSDNIIGGTTALARNVVVNNINAGIALQSSTTTDNTVEGNYVGVGSDGATVLGNGNEGIDLFSDGGSETIADNIVAGSGSVGIRVFSNNNVIQNDFIGTDATGTVAAGQWRRCVPGQRGQWDLH